MKPALPVVLVWLSIVSLGAIVPLPCACGETMESMIFATFAEDTSGLKNVLLMAKSIRAFGGQFRNAPVWIYIPGQVMKAQSAALATFPSLGMEVRTFTAPEEPLWLFYARKVFAAAQAESEASGRARILAWLDDDTIVLDEPKEFILPSHKNLGYRPVMHKNIGLLYDEPIDAFWARVFARLSVPESAVFPVVTPADGDTLRPYFNAGCMVVRPERGLFRKWVDCFKVLYQDSVLTDMCKQDNRKRIFLHQVALTGAILTHLKREEMIEFSDRINYPIFFEQMFGAKKVFDNLAGVVTFRHESYFAKPRPDWEQRLKGPADKVAWIRENLVGRPPE